MIHTETTSYPSAAYRSQAPAFVLKMLIPELMSVWGRRNDPLRPVSVRTIEDGLKLLTVQHKDEAAVLETLVLDMRLGIVVKHFGMLTATEVEVQEVRPPAPVIL
ncbi:hypothetical protein CQ040_09945 [Microbacterium sp. MYb54]|nr:hypothetical protein CQ040_09945 [Microbacterium sp. MYb54]PRB26309.1 hypothetical protein CQ037_13380 [Microbacterium sp. MYb50]PRB66948.1 hypothetical protein CQ021_09635 [Microbacterium sp. MYb24]